jgi:Phage protein
MEPARDSRQSSRRSATENPESHRASALSFDEPGTSVEVPVPVLKFSIFYSFPARVIAAWCGVSPATAALWKQNKRKPSLQALRLFTLHRDELILGEAWRGWRVRAGAIVDPEGNATSQAQLRAYWLIMQYAAELARRNPADYDHFQSLLRQA